MNPYSFEETKAQSTLSMQEEFENTTISGYFVLYLRKTRSEKSHDYLDASVSESSVFKMFFVHMRKKSQRFQFLRSEERF